MPSGLHQFNDILGGNFIENIYKISTVFLSKGQWTYGPTYF